MQVLSVYWGDKCFVQLFHDLMRQYVAFLLDLIYLFCPRLEIVEVLHEVHEQRGRPGKVLRSPVEDLEKVYFSRKKFHDDLPGKKKKKKKRDEKKKPLTWKKAKSRAVTVSLFLKMHSFCP